MKYTCVRVNTKHQSRCAGMTRRLSLETPLHTQPRSPTLQPPSTAAAEEGTYRVRHILDIENREGANIHYTYTRSFSPSKLRYTSLYLPLCTRVHPARLRSSIRNPDPLLVLLRQKTRRTQKPIRTLCIIPSQTPNRARGFKNATEKSHVTHSSSHPASPSPKQTA